MGEGGPGTCVGCVLPAQVGSTSLQKEESDLPDLTLLMGDRSTRVSVGTQLLPPCPGTVARKQFSGGGTRPVSRRPHKNRRENSSRGLLASQEEKTHSGEACPPPLPIHFLFPSANCWNLNPVQLHLGGPVSLTSSGCHPDVSPRMCNTCCGQLKGQHPAALRGCGGCQPTGQLPGPARAFLSCSLFVSWRKNHGMDTLRAARCAVTSPVTTTTTAAAIGFPSCSLFFFFFNKRG